MAAIDNALTTLSQAKSYLGIRNSTNDALLTKIIVAVSAFVENAYCRRVFRRQAYTQELYNGKDSKSLFTKNFPIISGETFTLQRRTTDNNNDEWETLDSEDYYIDYSIGKITLASGKFEEGIQNYRITYTAGYTLPSSADYQNGDADDSQDLPYDLELAVLDLITLQYQTRKSKGINREKVRDVEISYMKALKDDPTIKATLDTYKSVSYG